MARNSNVPLTPRQRERQERREASGQYAKMVPCYAGCGRRVNPAGGYFSHQLSDTIDAEGVGFDDAGLILCEPCASACRHQTTRREFVAFVRTHDAELADRLERAARAVVTPAVAPTFFEVEIAHTDDGHRRWYYEAVVEAESPADAETAVQQLYATSGMDHFAQTGRGQMDYDTDDGDFQILSCRRTTKTRPVGR